MNNLLIGLIIFMAAFVPRLFLAVFYLEVATDADVYGTVANNILNNGCVSLADPAGGACTPHWGGNQFPGFPLFIAMIWAILPENWIGIALAQSVLFSLSVTYLWRALSKFLVSPTAAIFAALIVALSPLSTPWARFILADTLSLAVVVIVMAELIRSLDQGKLRIPALGLVLGVGFFIRFDTIFLSIPVAMVGFYLHSFGAAIRRGLTIFIILVLPVMAWSARGISSGLGPYPNVFFIASGYEPPMGYIYWAKSWATSQYQAPMWWYPIHLAQYSKIEIPQLAYRTVREKQLVQGILNDLKSHDGAQFPKNLDDRFLKIAEEYKTDHPIRYWLGLPLERLAYVWFNPMNSAGWPVRTGWTNGIPDLGNLLSVVVANPLSAIVKGGSAAYRIGLLLTGLIFLVFYRTSISSVTTILLLAALSHALFRSIFLGWGFFVETRYLLQLFPMLEMTLVLCLFEIFRVNSDVRPQQDQE